MRRSRGYEGPPWGWDEVVPGDLPPPLRPSALLLPRGGTGFAAGLAATEPRPAPGKNRERGARSPSLWLSLFPQPGRWVLSPIVPSRCSGAGSACGAREEHGGGSTLRLASPVPTPPFPAASHREGAAPVLSGRAEVLTAAGAAGLVKPGRGEMLLFNPLPGPQGAWLSPAFGEAFSAQKHRPFPPPQFRVPSAGCVETSRLPGPAPQGQDLAPCLKYPQKPSRTSLPAGVSSLRVGEAARREAEGCGAVPADG